MWINLGRRNSEVPMGVCLRCFNSQEQYRFPYAVYCEHNEVLAIVSSPSEHKTLACKPEDYQELLKKLEFAKPV